MKSHRALAVLSELRSLAAHDRRKRAAARERLVQAEAEMAAARAEFDSADARAEVSGRVVAGAESLVLQAAGGQAKQQPEGTRTTTAASQVRRPTIAREVLDFLRLRGSATQAEIIQHAEETRPDIMRSSLRRQLGRMVSENILTLTDGVYAKASAPSDGGS